MPVHPPVGSGAIERLVTHSGMEIVSADYRLAENHAIHFSSEGAMVDQYGTIAYGYLRDNRWSMR
ncbi:hypothetical protein [Paenibacillus dendritiformis]|uniref:hypothetical protein n=1 Tax=Paenibacillus dendritiformis TaxID=130049 RepID=UPI0020C39655|nr:hypothetical protein [Paenibacillus dendritiformis]CAH8770605.1 hypothetical protein H7S4_003340 [Paenibacillus dendritiformis]